MKLIYPPRNLYKSHEYLNAIASKITAPEHLDYWINYVEFELEPCLVKFELGHSQYEHKIMMLRLVLKALHKTREALQSQHQQTADTVRQIHQRQQAKTTLHRIGTRQDDLADAFNRMAAALEKMEGKVSKAIAPTLPPVPPRRPGPTQPPPAFDPTQDTLRIDDEERRSDIDRVIREHRIPPGVSPAKRSSRGFG